MRTPESVAGLEAHLRERRAPDRRIRIGLPGHLIEVITDSAALVDELVTYFGDLCLTDDDPVDTTIVVIEDEAPDLDLEYIVKPPDPGKTKIKEESVDLGDGRIVRKRLTGMLFAFGGGVNVAWGPCRANANQVVNFVCNRHIQRALDDGYLLCHASAVTAGGRGAAVAGFSGMGKSTMALHLMSAGADFVSNDRLMIKRAGDRLAMRGVPKLPRVNPGTILGNPDLAGVILDEDRARCEALPAEELWSLEEKHDVFIDTCFGPGRFRLAAEMDALVLLNWSRGSSRCVAGRVSIREHERLLGAFRKDVGLFYLAPAAQDAPTSPTAEYVEALGDLPVITLNVGIDFKAGVEVVMDFLKEGRLPPLMERLP